MSTPAFSCSFTASSVASRLARASSSPLDFQGAHSVLGSASHSGFGKEPAIVVGNSILRVSSVFQFVWWSICHVLGTAYISFRRGGRRRKAYIQKAYIQWSSNSDLSTAKMEAVF